MMIDGESGVAMLDWPAHQGAREDLARQRMPRLLLVTPLSAPPICTDLLEDWIRCPADKDDTTARLRTLADRYRARTQPTVDEHGILRQGDTLIFLSPYEALLTAVLIEHFGEVVRSQILQQAIAEVSDASRLSLRVHASRLRKRIAPLGLTISCLRNVGYVMHREAIPIT